jgi:hypothetical protein
MANLIITNKYHRHVLHSRYADISAEPLRGTSNICNTAWTQDVKDAWIAFKARARS